jgi:hypothetical protein
VTDPSDFEGRIDVTGSVADGSFRVMRLEASSVSNALAALLLDIRVRTGVIPHI